MSSHGFVLHQWDWSETSLVLDLFTREEGRIAALAKGAKRPYSQLRPVLMPFQPLLLGLTRPKRARSASGPRQGDEGPDIVSLRSAEYQGAGIVLPPARLLSGFHLNELLQKLLARGDAHPELHDHYRRALRQLAAAPDEAAAGRVLRAFELRLLRAAGHLPDLAHDTLTLERLEPARLYRLGPTHGVQPLAAAADAAQGLPGALLTALESALGRTVLADDPVGDALTATLDAALGAGPERAGPLRRQLRELLLYHAGTPSLRTAALRDGLAALAAAPPPDPTAAA